jgi:large subunit ribosomal protein L35
MPKMKTHKGAAKRFKKTGSGKFKRSRAYLNKYHIRKSSRAKRGLRRGAYVTGGEVKVLKKLLPYA